MMATVPHVISGLGLRKFQADGFLLTRVYLLYGFAMCNSLKLRRLVRTNKQRIFLTKVYCKEANNIL